MREAYDYGGKNRHQAFPQLDQLSGLRLFQAEGKHIFIDPAPAQMRDIQRLLADFPADALIADEMCWGAGLAHEVGGPPLATVATSVYVFDSRDTAPVGLGLPPSTSPVGRARNKALKTVIEQVVLRRLWRDVDRMRASIGLAARRPHGLGNVTAPPQLYLLGTVPSFEYPRTDLFPYTHFVGPLAAPSPAEFAPPAWWADLDDDRPVIHVTQGTVSNDNMTLLAPTLRAMATDPVLVVATTGGTPVDQLELGPLPGNARLVPFIPHARLLPRVDVMVTNGGYGGVHAAIANGVPLVVAGATEEKPEVAAHVAWSGVGVNLGRRAPSPARIHAAVLRVLHDPRYRDRAGQLRTECAQAGGPAHAADLVEQLARTGRPVPALPRPQP
jgi:MGT family glycosyltransferase